MNNAFYLTNVRNYLFGFNGAEQEDIHVQETISLVRDRDGKIIDGYIPIGESIYQEDETYTAKRFWVLVTKGYNLIARFDCKEKAEAELKRIVEELKNDSKVIVVKSDIK